MIKTIIIVNNNEKKLTAKATLLAKYADFANLFSKQNVNFLPKHSMHDTTIEIKKEKQSFLSFMYNHSAIKLQTFYAYINEY